MQRHIYDILMELTSTTSRLDKERILKNLSAEEESLFKNVAIAAYDPFTNYWIRTDQLLPGLIDEDVANEFDLVAYGLSELIPLKERILTGNAAKYHLASLLTKLDPRSAYVISGVINRDLRCGCSASTFNKVWPGLIPEFELMACHTLDEKTAPSMIYPAYAQMKYDAARVAIIVDRGTVTYRTRNGLTYNFVNENVDRIFLGAAARLSREQIVFDGELYQRKPDGSPESRTVSNGIATKMIRGTSSPEDWVNIGISVWDACPLADFLKGVCKTEYSKRFELIEQMFTVGDLVSPALNVIVKDYDEATALAKKYIKEGYEGIILKNPKGIWEAKRSKNCLKVKAVRQADLSIVGIGEGTGKYAGMMGYISCKSADGEVQVNVGTGFSDPDRKTIWERWLLAGIYPGDIITVEYNELIKPKNSDVYSLFLPRFIEFRPDKDVADDLAKIKSGT